MKKLITSAMIAMLLCCGTILKAQNNLQFNKALFVEFTAAGNASGVIFTQTVTVPAGKVWKIESASASSRSSSSTTYTYGNNQQLAINDKMVYTGTIPSNGIPNAYLPLWLPAGTYTVTITNVPNTGYTAYGVISGIEFNVTP